MVPMIIQSLVNSLSALIDTVMASKIDAVSAIGTALQIDTLMQGIAFGIAAGINIFVVQYYGSKDYKNMQKSFGLSLISVMMNALIWQCLSLFLNTSLLSLFIQDKAVIIKSFEYLKYACFSYVFTSLIMTFTFAYHSVQKTQIPLFISIITTIIHIGFNILFMFILKLGLQGAAFSLIVTQFLSLVMYIGYSVYSSQPFIGPFQNMFYYNYTFIKRIFHKVYPLVINETLFSIGNSMFIVAYGVFGKEVMDCYYIGNQIVNLFYTIVNATSDAATSLIGYELGRENYDYVEKEVNYFFGMTTCCSILIVIAILVFAPHIVSMFQVDQLSQVSLSIAIIRVLSIRIAFRLFNVIIFASLRAGGDSQYLTFIDSIIMWLVGISLTFISIYLFKCSSIVIVILIGQLEQFVRLILGLKRLKSKKWINHMV